MTCDTDTQIPNLQCQEAADHECEVCYSGGDNVQRLNGLMLPGTHLIASGTGGSQ